MTQIAAPFLDAQVAVIKNSVAVAKLLIEGSKIHGIDKVNLLECADGLVHVVEKYAAVALTPLDASKLPDPFLPDDLMELSDWAEEALREGFEKELSFHGERAEAIIKKYGSSIGEEAEALFQFRERPLTAGVVDIGIKIGFCQNMAKLLESLQHPVSVFEELLGIVLLLNLQQVLKAREEAKDHFVPEGPHGLPDGTLIA